ncbi:hypothetical protein [Streptomyces sp. NBC_01276]|uniref:hypothetical protein n=1 Tax=Streptomyces sp. NBC_01276 TaxID=2903808 RepID=UPI00352C3DFD
MEARFSEAAALLSSLADKTSRGPLDRPIRRHEYQFTERVVAGAEWVPFTATTRMPGVDLPDGKRLRKGAISAVAA